MFVAELVAVLLCLLVQELLPSLVVLVMLVGVLELVELAVVE